ncbi:hypothetical protein [Rhizorhabdus wittichii]|uniref:hypothetical protein n=1 Tax=Rhizorhabdus wittichii TaxID=160791 RepID=UPI0003141484|nr:hypothetical protein [Rhizorhabdus wittichii]
MDQDDREYFERRHRESLQRADDASDPALAAIYRGFAEHYSNALGGVGPRPVADRRDDPQLFSFHPTDMFRARR